MAGGYSAIMMVDHDHRMLPLTGGLLVVNDRSTSLEAGGVGDRQRGLANRTRQRVAGHRGAGAPRFGSLVCCGFCQIMGAHGGASEAPLEALAALADHGPMGTRKVAEDGREYYVSSCPMVKDYGH